MLLILLLGHLHAGAWLHVGLHAAVVATFEHKLTIDRILIYFRLERTSIYKQHNSPLEE
ncbi:hypothetical protein V6Z11_A03G205500 [Gossypium hirsutum]